MKLKRFCLLLVGDKFKSGFGCCSYAFDGISFFFVASGVKPTVQQCKKSCESDKTCVAFEVERFQVCCSFPSILLWVPVYAQPQLDQIMCRSFKTVKVFGFPQNFVFDKKCGSNSTCYRKSGILFTLPQIQFLVFQCICLFGK